MPWTGCGSITSQRAQARYAAKQRDVREGEKGRRNLSHQVGKELETRAEADTETAGGKRHKRKRQLYSSGAGSAEKEKRDKKMKVAVDRLWQHYVAEGTRERRGRGKEEVLERRAGNTKQGGSRASGSYTRAGNGRRALSMRKCRRRGGAALKHLTYLITSIPSPFISFPHIPLLCCASCRSTANFISLSRFSFSTAFQLPSCFHQQPPSLPRSALIYTGRGCKLTFRN